MCQIQQVDWGWRNVRMFSSVDDAAVSTLSDLRYSAWKLKCINKYIRGSRKIHDQLIVSKLWVWSMVLIWIFPDKVFTPLYAHFSLASHDQDTGEVAWLPRRVTWRDTLLTIYIQSKLNISWHRDLHDSGFNHAIDMTVKYSSVREAVTSHNIFRP